MISLITKYPGRIDTTDATNYPYGKARNVTATGDGTGTPLEKNWVNDLWGWMAALVTQAGITPSGNPDTAIASDLLNAIKAIILQRQVARYTVSGTKNTSQSFNLTATADAIGGGWSLTSNVVTVPASGKYRVSLSGLIKCTATTSPLIIGGGVYADGGVNAVSLLTTQVIRYSASGTDFLPISGETIVTISSPATQGISVAALQDNTQIVSGANLVIERVG